VPIDRVAVHEALAGSIVAAFPELTIIFRAEDSGLETLADIVTAQGLPYAVVDLRLETTGEWGLGNRVEAGTADIYLFTGDETSGDAWDTKVVLLQRELKTNFNDAEVAQVLHWPTATFSPTLATVAFFVNTQRPFRSVLVSAPIIVGETP
jgi:hypothetical protein